MIHRFESGRRLWKPTRILLLRYTALSVTLPIWVLVAAVLIIAALVFGLHRNHLEKRREERARSERRIDELRREQTKQLERLRRERKRIERTGHVDFVEDLVGPLDGLRRALQEAEGGSTADADVTDGVEMSLRAIEDVLRRHDIEVIEPASSESFDPEHHEALRAVDDTDVEPGSVVVCHRPGYRHRDRVVRPALVEVAVGAEADSSDRPDADSSAETKLEVDAEDEPESESSEEDESEEPAEARREREA